MEYKRCANPECENPWLPATEEYFHKQLVHSKRKGDYYRLTSKCKICNRRKQNIYRAEHKEECNERKREWYKDKNNKLRVKVYNKEYNENDPTIKRNNLKNWQINNPEKVREHNNKRTKKEHKISDEEWKNCKQYFDNLCAYCGLHISEHFIAYAGKLKHTDFHREHVDDDGANDLSNCVPSCKSCNSEKHTFELEEWYNKDNPKYTQERHDKIVQWLITDYKVSLKV